MWETRAFSSDDQYASMSSTGGGSCPRAPRNTFVNDCCNEVKTWSAVASSSAATFTATIECGCFSCAEGWKRAR